MDVIPTKSDLMELLALSKRADNVVSIYIPTHPSSAPQNLNEDKARFKNALQQADGELEEKGLRQSERKSILDGAWDLYEDLDFWQHRDRALAVFLAPNELKRYRLPIETDELTVVGGDFVLSPLAVAADMPGYYYVLKLDLNQPKLFLASWHIFDQVDIKDMPGKMEDALQISGYEQEQQFNSIGNNKVQGGGQALYHGHGGAKDNRSIMVVNYLRMVDKAVDQASLVYPEAPFIIAANAEHAGMFRSISRKSIEHVIGKDLAGKEELRKKVLDYLNNQLEFKAQEFSSYTDSDKGADIGDYSLAQLSKMAVRGQVKRLGIGMLNATRDSVRNVKGRITKLDLSMDKEWLARAEALIRDVLNNGGDVTGTFIEDNQRGLQAVLRYKA